MLGDVIQRAIVGLVNRLYVRKEYRFAHAVSSTGYEGVRSTAASPTTD
jgi:hypothetical protein